MIQICQFNVTLIDSICRSGVFLEGTEKVPPLLPKSKIDSDVDYNRKIGFGCHFQISAIIVSYLKPNYHLIICYEFSYYKHCDT